MATRYWVGGSGNFYQTTNWSTSTGGAGGAGQSSTNSNFGLFGGGGGSGGGGNQSGGAGASGGIIIVYSLASEPILMELSNLTVLGGVTFISA